MFQKDSLINGNLCQEVMTKVDNFYVIFPVLRKRESNYILVNVKGSVYEMNTFGTIVKGVVLASLRKRGITCFECASREDFDNKFAVYRLTDDPDIFGDPYET